MIAYSNAKNDAVYPWILNPAPSSLQRFVWNTFVLIFDEKPSNKKFL